MRNLVVVFVSLALLGLIEAALHGGRFRSERRARELRRRLQAATGPVPLDSNLLRQGRFANIAALDGWLSRQGWARQLEHLLEQADSRMTVAQLVGFSFLGALTG